MELDDEIREFLIESNECLGALDRDILLLEDNPDDKELISSVFRGIHTIKGTCGFFGFDILGAVTHLAENILSQIRDRERTLTHEVVSLILETLDAVKILLARIETTGSEGDDMTGALRLKLENAAKRPDAPLKIEAPLDKVEPVAPPHEMCSDSSIPSPGTLVDLHNPQSETSAPTVSPVNAGLSEKRVDAFEIPNPASEVAVIQVETPSPVVEPTFESAKEAFLSESTIRVDVTLLNRLMNLVGELVLARNQLMQDISKHNPSLQQTSQRLNLITSELQEGVMKTRMQPIGLAWNKLPRVIRDLAEKCGKRIQIEMVGAETELDKTIIEAIRDPLTHIVRNSCDHGIEPPEVRLRKGKRPDGLIQLRAYHEGGVVNIEIADDGAGIDPQRVKAKALEKGLLRPEQAANMSDREATYLIFLPGFSTATQVTSVSGRGVGMDVVKTNIEKIGGTVDLLNRGNGGTSIRIKIPLTLAIIPGLIVALTCAGRTGTHESPGNQEERFIIPQANLLELVRLEAPALSKRIDSVHSTPVFHHRGKLLPLVYLGRVLGRAQHVETQECANIIVLQSENRQLGLVVDKISDTQEIVVKPLGRQLKGLSCYVGATIMGDGKPALILDVAGLAKLAGLGAHERPLAHGTQASSEHPSSQQSQMMLLFRASHFNRMAVPLALVDRLEEVSLSRIAHTVGQPVLHYRDGILPLVTLDNTSRPANHTDGVPDRSVQIIVFTDGRRRFGLIVDQVLDIIDEPITVRRNSPTSAALGSAIIGGQITDLLNMHSLLKSAGENWLGNSVAEDIAGQKLLLVDESFAAREIIRDVLTASGHSVLVSPSPADAITQLKHRSDIRGLLLSTRPAENIEDQAVEALCAHCMRLGIPMVELLDSLRQLHSTSRFSMRVVRTDCERLIDLIATLPANTPAEDFAI